MLTKESLLIINWSLTEVKNFKTTILYQKTYFLCTIGNYIPCVSVLFFIYPLCLSLISTCSNFFVIEKSCLQYNDCHTNKFQTYTTLVSNKYHRGKPTMQALLKWPKRPIPVTSTLISAISTIGIYSFIFWGYQGS